MITVDVHAHVLLPAIEQAVAGRPGLEAHRELDARRNGPGALAVSGAMIGERIGLLTRVADRLAAMDAAGVDAQVVSPSPSHYHYWAGDDLAAEVCRLAAEGVAEHVAQAPAGCTGSAWLRSSTPSCWSPPWTRRSGWG
ncbi:hypothetical protein ACFQ0B_38565 [Nonomuraea thailandensis]